MMIVSVTRVDLHDEFDMADEAFTLSTITARTSLPSAEDYDAISQALMETSRGRWFLSEYAIRNRNADTRMVLNAVTRIEKNLTAQKQTAFGTDLRVALAELRYAVDKAQGATRAAVESLVSDENRALVRKGAQIIREISWRWREIHADNRICDLLDSQVATIEEACGQISLANPQAALDAAFELIRARIAQLEDAKAAISMPTEAIVEVIETTAEIADLDVTSEATNKNCAAEDAYDEALLDMVALEMAAPDPTSIDDTPDTATDEVH